jgi:hypothetical protein
MRNSRNAAPYSPANIHRTHFMEAASRLSTHRKRVLGSACPVPLAARSVAEVLELRLGAALVREAVVSLALEDQFVSPSEVE